MIRNVKISWFGLIKIFIVFFPVLPLYFMVQNICVSNILAALVGCCGMIFVLRRYGANIKANAICFLIILWAFLRFCAYEVSGQYMEGIWFLFRTIICGIVVSLGIDSKDKFIKALRLLVYTSGIISIFGIIEGITQFNVFELINTVGAELNYNPLRYGLLRIISFTSQTIVYCLYCMFMASIAFYLLTFEKNKNKRLILKIIYAMLWINGILTLSRSSLIAFIVSQLILLYGCGYTKFIKKLVQIICIGFIIFGILGLVFPKILTVGQNLLYMILAVFNDKYAEAISSAFGNDNLTGIGNRLQLYEWVWESMREHALFGMGSNAVFSYDYVAHYGVYDVNTTKTSIEVQYLYILYHFGIVGLVSEILAYLALLAKCVRTKFSAVYWEKKLSFSFVSFSIFIIYFITMFAVNQSSEGRTFYLLVFLLFAYSRIKQIDEQEVRSLN